MNQMASASWGIRLEVARSMHALETIIIAECKKPINAGERRKRLRTVLETLASWWSSGGGRSLAPYVKANRRDGDRAIVHGRSGKFLKSCDRSILQCGCLQKIGGRGGGDQCARSAIGVEQLRARRCRLTCPNGTYARAFSTRTCGLKSSDRLAARRLFTTAWATSRPPVGVPADGSTSQTAVLRRVIVRDDPVRVTPWRVRWRSAFQGGNYSSYGRH